MGDADYMLEHGLDPFMKKTSDGDVVEWEGGINPLYKQDPVAPREPPNTIYSSFSEAAEYAKKNGDCVVKRNPNGDGYICQITPTLPKPNGVTVATNNSVANKPDYFLASGIENNTYCLVKVEKSTMFSLCGKGPDLFDGITTPRRFVEQFYNDPLDREHCPDCSKEMIDRTLFEQCDVPFEVNLANRVASPDDLISMSGLGDCILRGSYEALPPISDEERAEIKRRDLWAKGQKILNELHFLRAYVRNEENPCFVIPKDGKLVTLCGVPALGKMHSVDSPRVMLWDLASTDRQTYTPDTCPDCQDTQAASSLNDRLNEVYAIEKELGIDLYEGYRIFFP